MNHFRLSHLSIFLSLALIAGCTTTTTVVQPASTGTMTGTVSLYEMDGTASASSAGVDVTILGASRHATSDGSGQFTFDSLPAGYYQLQSSKPGFSTYITTTPQPFAGADTLWLLGTTPKLYRINNWKLTLAGITAETYIRPGIDTTILFQSIADSISLIDSTGNPARLSGGLLPSAIFFLGPTPNINYADTTSYFTWQNTTPNEEPTLLSIPRDIILTDTIYLIAYPASGTNNTVFQYYSGQTLKTAFGGLGPPSNVLKIVLP